MWCVMEAKNILLYTPVLKWYLDHGLKVTAFYQYLEDLKEIGGAYEIREGKRYVSVDRAYQ